MSKPTERENELLTDTLFRQIEKRTEKAGVTTSCYKILTAMNRIGRTATREEIAKINGYNVGGVSSKQVDYLTAENLVTKESTRAKGDRN